MIPAKIVHTNQHTNRNTNQNASTNENFSESKNNTDEKFTFAPIINNIQRENGSSSSTNSTNTFTRLASNNHEISQIKNNAISNEQENNSNDHTITIQPDREQKEGSKILKNNNDKIKSKEPQTKIINGNTSNEEQLQAPSQQTYKETERNSDISHTSHVNQERTRRHNHSQSNTTSTTQTLGGRFSWVRRLMNNSRQANANRRVISRENEKKISSSPTSNPSNDNITGATSGATSTTAISNSITAPNNSRKSNHRKKNSVKSIDQRLNQSVGETTRGASGKNITNNNNVIISGTTDGQLPANDLHVPVMGVTISNGVNNIRLNDDSSYNEYDDISTVDNVSTVPILSLSSTSIDSRSYDDDRTHSLLGASTAMTSITPTYHASINNSYHPASSTSNNTSLNANTNLNTYSTGQQSNQILTPNSPTGSESLHNSNGTHAPNGAPLPNLSSLGAAAMSGSGGIVGGAGSNITGHDSASVITIASSTRQRSRRRSIDTNASISAIPPASIFERIYNSGTMPTASSINTNFTSGTGMTSNKNNNYNYNYNADYDNDGHESLLSSIGASSTSVSQHENPQRRLSSSNNTPQSPSINAASNDISSIKSMKSKSTKD
ncbi:unnamed protein product [[Candida] boidinii]|uniref:Unnamed protein product n=1 Tax=Candida boidinii TaxID=5477 RepID=A0A9W6WIM9_CANBO|nr:unnamed protein product [[Candida] boidinii]